MISTETEQLLRIAVAIDDDAAALAIFRAAMKFKQPEPEALNKLDEHLPPLKASPVVAPPKNSGARLPRAGGARRQRLRGEVLEFLFKSGGYATFARKHGLGNLGRGNDVWLTHTELELMHEARQS